MDGSLKETPGKYAAVGYGTVHLFFGQAESKYSEYGTVSATGTSTTN